MLKSMKGQFRAGRMEGRRVPTAIVHASVKGQLAGSPLQKEKEQKVLALSGIVTNTHTHTRVDNCTYSPSRSNL